MGSCARSVSAALVAVLAGTAGGCNLVFGLDEGRAGDGGAIDAAVDADRDAGPCDDPVVEEDGDGVADSCDNCPHVPNSDQADDDEDKVGNVCDPDPGQANDILLFEGFNGPGLGDWRVSGGNWVQEGGFARQIDLQASLALLVRDQIVPDAAVIGVGVHVDELAVQAMDTRRVIGMWFQATVPQPGLYPDGTECELRVDVGNNVSLVQLEQWAAQVGTPLSNMQVTPPLAAGQAYTLAADGSSLGRGCAAYADGITLLGAVTAPAGLPVGQALALRTRHLTARWSFVVVISRVVSD